MDTKARVAIIVGGVVLVGMVAWVLMPSGKSKKPADSEPPFVENTEQNKDANQFAAAPTTAPSTQPVAVDPFAAPTTLPSTAVNIGPSLPPADNTDSWARALDGNGGPSTAARTGTSLAANDGFSSHFGTSTTSTTVIPADATTPKSYTIASGDSLYTISQKIYGNGTHVAKILAANPGLDAKHLKVGQTIKLPDATGTASAATPASGPGPVASAVSGTNAKTYKVQSGDSLRKIATKVYGDAGKWEKLYAANRKLIGSNPSDLRAGMVLQLPN
jgi:nucleoid-associated protein YgaU